MLAEVVTIGDEICSGEIVDTDSSWLAGELWEHDVTVAWLTSCRDSRNDMTNALRQAAARSQLVLVSGGLGPTVDDLTVDVVAAMVGTEPVIDAEARDRMLARYRSAGREPAPSTERQVRVPSGARIHRNPAGAAPGFEVDIGGTPVVCLPGVPRELRAIWDTCLAERVVELRDRDGERTRIARRTFRCFGRGESDVAGKLDGLIDGSERVSIHYRAHFPEIWVKLVVRDRDPAEAESELERLGGALRDRLGWLVYGTDDESLAAAVGDLLRARGATVSCAESCTGGMVGAALTSVPGSSDYFVGGAITYSNAEKVRQLGVSEATLATAGAVSEECVSEMAAGIRERTGSDIGVAISGIAGPGGGSDDKPVGTVWLAAATAERVATKRFVWPGERARVRQIAAHWALAMIRRELSDEPSG